MLKVDKAFCFAVNVTGSCSDWVKKELNVPLVYTIYMMNEDHVMPRKSDSRVLTSHLSLLLEEILTISKPIYGPLYNSTMRIYVTKTFLAVILCLTNFLQIISIKSSV